ncbi:hypothetical protein GCM10008908_03670 [Clostridium subterminale]|uniref:Uncharacterized protein n=1 Tax=Clostridium subterminale TaxID=1550 RepID=A0ABN1KH06_CLOSU
MSYYNGHRELGMNGCNKNLGISKSALSNLVNAAKEHKGEVPTRGSGNYSSDEAKEIARLKRNCVMCRMHLML